MGAHGILPRALRKRCFMHAAWSSMSHAYFRTGIIYTGNICIPVYNITGRPTGIRGFRTNLINFFWSRPVAATLGLKTLPGQYLDIQWPKPEFRPTFRTVVAASIDWCNQFCIWIFIRLAANTNASSETPTFPKLWTHGQKYSSAQISQQYTYSDSVFHYLHEYTVSNQFPIINVYASIYADTWLLLFRLK